MNSTAERVARPLGAQQRSIVGARLHCERERSGEETAERESFLWSFVSERVVLPELGSQRIRNREVSMITSQPRVMINFVPARFFPPTPFVFHGKRGDPVPSSSQIRLSMKRQEMGRGRDCG